MPNLFISGIIELNRKSTCIRSDENQWKFLDKMPIANANWECHDGGDVAPQLPNGALYNWSCIDSQGVGTCQLGALSVIMRNAMIALYVITIYLGFGVNLVGGYINCQRVQQCICAY